MNRDYELDTYELYKYRQLGYGAGEDKQDISNRLIKTPEDFENYHRNYKVNDQNGATVVFTGKQFIFSKNPNEGQKGHVYAFAETYLAMENDKSSINFNEACWIAAREDKKYLRMTIEDEQYKRIPYRCVRVYIHDAKISPGELASFKAFNDQFGYLITKHGFSFFVRNDGENEQIDITSMDNLLGYLESITDENKEAYVNPKGEEIIGCPNGYDETMTKTHN